MIERFLNLYAVIFARPLFRQWNLFLLAMGLRGIGILNYKTPYLSGEDAVVAQIVRELDERPAVVLDIGANEGDFTGFVLSNTRNVRVMSFEPHPRTHVRLQERFAKNSRTEILNVAVGSEPGEISLFDYDSMDGSQHATMYRDVIEVTRGVKANESKVKLITLDSLTIDAEIGLVKIDVEGFELSVLQGGRKLIKEKRPRFLVIEFNEMNVNSHTFFKDLCNELPGYKAERILPGGKTFPLNSPYRAWHHEIFAYQNILFTRLG